MRICFTIGEKVKNYQYSSLTENSIKDNFIPVFVCSCHYTFVQKADTFIFYFCFNKLTQSQWIKTISIYSLFYRSVFSTGHTGLKQYDDRIHSFWKLSGRIYFLAFPALRGCPHSLALGDLLISSNTAASQSL